MRPVTSKTIALTATVPVEILLAAGLEPLDLNNVFITAPDPARQGDAVASPAALVAEAEHRGFPLNCCAWIKGIYATARRLGVRRVIGVSQGDCSNTHALMEVLESEGVEVIDFNYPFPKDRAALAAALADLAARLGTTVDEAEQVRRRLEPVRAALAEIDRLSWEEDRVSGEENHRWLIGSSDFGGDPEAYGARPRRSWPRPAAARRHPPATAWGTSAFRRLHRGCTSFWKDWGRGSSSTSSSGSSACRQRKRVLDPFPVWWSSTWRTRIRTTWGDGSTTSAGPPATAASTAWCTTSRVFVSGTFRIGLCARRSGCRY